MLKFDLKPDYDAIPELRDALLIVWTLKIMSPKKFFTPPEKMKENIFIGWKPGLN